VNDIENVISGLEKQRSAIDRAILALREITGASTSATETVSQGTSRKRRLSPEGRKRIIAATKKRWAAKRAAEAGTAPKSATAPSRSRRGAMSVAGRKRLALVMKRRWATAKKAGKKQLA